MKINRNKKKGAPSQRRSRKEHQIMCPSSISSLCLYRHFCCNFLDFFYRNLKKVCYLLLSYKFTDDAEYIEREIQTAGPRTLVFALVPEHMTGKIVKEA